MDNYRHYFSEKNFNGKRQYWSEWVELKKGKHYYLEGRHTESTGSDHFTVAVEIEQS